MGFFDRFKKKAEIETPSVEPRDTHVAFVLLKEAKLPSSAAVIEAFERFKGPSEQLIEEVDDEPADSDANEAVMILRLEGVGQVWVALIPKAVPGEEAEFHFSNSLSSFSESAELGTHSAQLLVSLMGIDQSDSPLRDLMAFTSLLAAVTAASGAIGVYWGNGCVTHTADFVMSVAEEHSVIPRVMLWNGVSRAGEGAGKISYLSHGMGQLGLPNLYMTTSSARAGEGLQQFFSYLAYVAERGEPIPSGDTIGGSDDERIKIRYVNSPAEDGSIVWSISL